MVYFAGPSAQSQHQRGGKTLVFAGKMVLKRKNAQAIKS